MLRWLIARPCLVKNNADASAAMIVERWSNQLLIAETALLPIGTILALFPLPNTVSIAP